MSTIDIGLMSEGSGPREDRTSRLLTAASVPVRRWPERRIVVLTAALLLFVGIFVLREVTKATGDAISLLYVLPVALVALELGLRAGLVVALAAAAGVAVWMQTRVTGLDAVALVVRSLIFLAVAAIVGRFSDRMRATSVREARLLRSGLDLARLEEADSLTDLLADHVRRAVRAESVTVELLGSAPVSIGVQAGETLRLPVVSHGSSIGSIEVSSGAERRFTPEDRLMLETLALQAAVASDNQRLLAVQREQAALRGEIERMRRRLGEQARNASHVIESHEQERRGIARQLHEEAAQTMAAALVTVGLLERAPGELSQAQLEEVRSQVKSSIVDLRRLAGTLRPAVLDEMGLASALERLSEQESEDAGRPVSFSTDGLPERLPREVETSTYRAIEEVLDALDAAVSVTVKLRAQNKRMRIVVDAESLDGSGARREDVDRMLHSELAGTRARLELIGGSLHIGSLRESGARVVAELPLGSEQEPGL